MLSVELIIYIFFVYVLAGFVKGVVGVGLPTVSLALLAIFFRNERSNAHSPSSKPNY